VADYRAPSGDFVIGGTIGGTHRVTAFHQPCSAYDNGGLWWAASGGLTDAAKQLVARSRPTSPLSLGLPTRRRLHA
jgi:hypothetical protein